VVIPGTARRSRLKRTRQAATSVHIC
jgi:hypothetical protein